MGRRMSAERSACVMGTLRAKSLRKELSWVVGGTARGPEGLEQREQEEQPEILSDLMVTNRVENRL